MQFYGISFMHPYKRGPGSVLGIATGYGAGRSGDQISVGARFSAPVQTGPGAHPASYRMPDLFPGGKRPGRGDDHPPPPSAKVKERVELRDLSRVRFTLYIYIYIYI